MCVVIYAAAPAGKQGSKTGQTSLRSFWQQPLGMQSAATTTDSAAQPAPQVPHQGTKLPSWTQATHTTLPSTNAQLMPSDGPSFPLHIQAKPYLKTAEGALQLQKQAHEEVLSSTPGQGLGAIGQSRLSSDVCLGSGGMEAVDQHLPSAASSQGDLLASQDSTAAAPGDKAAVTAAWSKIHSKMRAPKCKGHNEDCVIREVKKSGPNKGMCLTWPVAQTLTRLLLSTTACSQRFVVEPWSPLDLLAILATGAFFLWQALL